MLGVIFFCFLPSLKNYFLVLPMRFNSKTPHLPCRSKVKGDLVGSKPIESL